MATARALLLTDLVDSTALVARLSAEDAAALGARVDGAVRAAIAAHGGREIDKSDGFLVVFDGVAGAVGCARAVHVALAAMDLRARAGVHWAPVALRENPADQVARGAKPIEAEGVGKAVAARVMAAAPGGRTLLTGDARAELPESAPVTAIGLWLLKGIADPVALWEDGTATEPVPDGPKHRRVVRQGDLWVPAGDIPRRLPVERDAFLGREGDLERIAEAMASPGLVTLLGPGGMGKTRLACRFAWTHLAEWPGGAWFCDLSVARDATDVASAVARSLDVPLGADPLRQVGEVLRGRGEALVVLDNAETAIDAVVACLSRWLDAAPATRFLVTSREALRISGERVLPLDALDRAEAAALFVARARAVDPRFAAADHADVIAEIVRRLDGMPLAIELCAARTRVLPPPKLLERLSRRFDLLSGNRRDVPRHATLRAAIDWSWDLLQPWEKAAFAQLSVFAGSFDVDAAEAVVSLGESGPVGLDAVESLVDKSLVRRLPNGRLALFPTIADYAAERLDEAGRAEAEARHGAWYGRPRAPLRGADAVARVEALEADAENLVAAGHRAVDRGDAPAAAAACEALVMLARRRPFVHAAVPLLERVVAMDGLDAARRRLLVVDQCSLAVRHESVDVLLDTAGEAREADDRGAEAQALSVLVHIAVRLGRHDDAAPSIARLEELIPSLPDAERIRAFLGLGPWLASSGDLPAAVRATERGLALAIAVEDPWARASTLGHLGQELRMLGEHDRSREALLDAMARHRELGHVQNQATTACTLADLEASLGHYEQAAAADEEARRLAAAIGDFALWNKATGDLSAAFTALGRHDEAVALAREALDAAERTEGPFAVADAALGLGQALSIRGDHVEALAVMARGMGLARDVGPGRPYLARALGVYAEALTRSGDASEAIVALHEGMIHARDAGDDPGLCRVLMRLADAWYELGDVARSRLYAQEALPLATGADVEEARRRVERVRG